MSKSWNRLDNAADTCPFRAFVAGVGGFANNAVEDRGLGALAVDASNLPGVPTVAKPGSIAKKNIIMDGGIITVTQSKAISGLDPLYFRKVILLEHAIKSKVSRRFPNLQLM